MRLLGNCKNEAGVSSGGAGLDGNFDGEEVGERKVTIVLNERSEPDGVKDSKSSASKRTEIQSSQGGMVECRVALKKEFKKIRQGKLESVLG